MRRKRIQGDDRGGRKRATRKAGKEKDLGEGISKGGREEEQNNLKSAKGENIERTARKGWEVYGERKEMIIFRS